MIPLVSSHNHSHSHSHLKPTDPELDQVRTRLLARLCVIFICVTQVFQRVFFTLEEPNLSHQSKVFYLASLPFFIVASIIVFLEYIYFRKYGSKILKHSRKIDVLFFLIFTAEWITVLYSAVIKAKPNAVAACYTIPAIFGFTSFSWRTLLQTFISQHWLLKAIPPIAAYGLVIGYAVHFDPEETVFTLIRGILQIIYIVVLFYFEDKIQWRMLLANMHKERWVQINDFILNNIPENIVILELGGGEPRFVSEYCKSFMRRAHLSQNPRDLFTSIKDLNQQPDTEPSSPFNVIFFIV